MVNNEELEKRIETLEKAEQHLKAILQYQVRNKKSDSNKVLWLYPMLWLVNINWRFCSLNIQAEH